MKESNKKRSESMKRWFHDHDHPQLGSKRSNISKELQGETIRSKPLVECVHCGKKSNIGMITRWHNDNCKKA